MKIIAHRGYSASFPENTPEGWNAAFATGAFAIEADVRLSADGHCICAHDADLKRLFDRPEQPEALALKDLLGLHNAAGGRIAVLAEVLEHAGHDRHVLLDLKDEAPHSLEVIWNAIVDIVPEGKRRFVIAGCHTIDAVRFFAARSETGILGFIPTQDQAEVFHGAGAGIIRFWEGDVTATRIQQLQQLGAEVWVTTGGQGTPFRGGETAPQNLARLAAAGASGVLVDDVAMAKATLETMP